VIRNSDGSNSTIVPLGGGTVIRNSDGSSATINQLGNSTITNGGGRRSNCTQLGMSVSCD
jgi:hypothetical protein